MEFKEIFSQWMKENPNATPKEVEIQKQIIQRRVELYDSRFL